MKSTIRNVPVESLHVHPIVQRIEGIDHRRVDRMAKDFQPSLLQVLTVSEQSDGTLLVTDGAHRLTLCRQADYDRPLRCEVFTGLTIAEEAALFLGRNNAKMPSAISKFHARVLMGDTAAKDITRTLDEAGWKVSVSDEDGNIAAVDALEAVYVNGAGVLAKGAHPDVLDRALRIITTAWEWDSKSSNGWIIRGVGQLVARFGENIDDHKLTEVMAGTRPTVLLGRAKSLRDIQGGTIPAALAKILVAMHNNKRRTNLLPEWVWVR